MKGIFKNKITRLLLISMTLFFAGAFCLEVTMAYQNPAMAMQAHSYAGVNAGPVHDASKNMMPCCGTNQQHDYASDVTYSKNNLQQPLILGVVSELVDLSLVKNNAFNISYSAPAPPGPDLLRTVIIRT